AGSDLAQFRSGLEEARMPKLFIIALIVLTITSLIAAILYWKRPAHRFLSLGVLVTAGLIVAGTMVLCRLPTGDGWASFDMALQIMSFDLLVGTLHLMFFGGLLIDWMSQPHR